MFNLEEDGNEEGLTHFGQSLGDMEKFDDIPLSDEELVEGEAKWVSKIEFQFSLNFRGYWRNSFWWIFEEEEDNLTT